MLAGFALFVLADQIGSAWLKNVAATTLFGTLFMLMLAVGLANIYNKVTTFAKGLWRMVAKIKTVFDTN